MKNLELGRRVKVLRQSACLSQEELAENAQLSLRTIQRIEIGETTPRGDTLRRLAMALQVSPGDLMDWQIQEDKGFLTAMNLACLAFLLFPLLGVVIPLVLWILKKDKVRQANEMGKALLNFQITWCMLYYGVTMLVMGWVQYSFQNMDDISLSAVSKFSVVSMRVKAVFYSYNFIFILTNAWRMSNGLMVKYFPSLPFLGRG